MPQRRVSYYFDRDLGAHTYGYGHAMKPHRIAMTHDLVSAYNMLDKMHVLRPKRANPKMMTAFHTDEYIKFLHNVTPETAEELTGRGSRYLIGDDNPCFEGLFEFCSISAGGSIAAAERINTGAADIAINWAGGLHHAKKSEASGFCYVNDIVLGILELLRTYPRVLYIDIDCHHGDGVEEAFYTTDRVMTCSFHKFGDYFPGTGLQEDVGAGKGKGYAVNVPFKDGIADQAFQSVFIPVIDEILRVFRPSAIVLQCGADSLSGDKLGCFNLTLNGHAACVQHIRSQNIPLVLLGGGGYSVKNVARTWTFETACALGIEETIDRNLPYNEYFDWFGPRYKLEVVASSMEDCNVRDGVLDRVRTMALKQLSELHSRCAPSSGLQDIPRESVSEHLGIGQVRVDGGRNDLHADERWDELDETLAQHSRYIYDLQSASNMKRRRPDASSSSSSSDEDDGNDHALAFEIDFDDVESSAHKQRRSNAMSIVTNRYLDTVLGASVHKDLVRNEPELQHRDKTTKRRFFPAGIDRSRASHRSRDRDDLESDETEMDV